MTTRTKIICTIGPSVNTFDQVVALMKAGMNVARLNMSHGTHEEHSKSIQDLKKARKELKQPLAIMLDTRGPEVRIGKIKDDEIVLTRGQRWLLVRDDVEGNCEKVTIVPRSVLDNLTKGTQVLFYDGYISSHVVDTTSEGVIVEIDNGGDISSGKGVNVPNRRLDLPAITDKDVEDICFGCQHDVDIIAVSFVRSAENIIMIKNLLAKENKPDTLVIAKIENHEGVENVDNIIQVADGVMIARGDLGVEVPLSKVPKLQKDMIRKSNLAGKISVTATQMLESMIRNPRPTRAEVSDVANAIYDSTSAIMLSGETAIGKYPIKAVQMMKSIVREAESDFDYRSFFQLHSTVIYNDVPSSVTLASVKTAYSSHAKAIFAFTSSGSTARLLARLRPEMPIVAMTPLEKCYHQLSLTWGVIPYLGDDSKSFLDAFPKIGSFALDQNIVSFGDLVVVTAGSPFGVVGTTNMMIVENIGDVLVRGHKGYGSRVHGKVRMVLSLEGVEPFFVRGKVIIIPQCDNSFLPFIQESAGVILQNHIDDEASEIFAMDVAKEYDKPLIVRADAAFYILKEDQLVTLDPEKALVYKGAVL